MILENEFAQPKFYFEIFWQHFYHSQNISCQRRTKLLRINNMREKKRTTERIAALNQYRMSGAIL